MFTMLPAMPSADKRAPTNGKSAGVWWRAAECLLWLLVLSCCGAFAFFYIVTPTQWYRFNATDFINWRNAHLEVQLHGVNATTGRNTAIIAPFPMMQIIWQWGCTLGAALGMGLLLWMRTAEHRPANTSSSGACAGRPAKIVGKVKDKAQRLLRYQLPPRGLWHNLLGGLTVMELLVILLWLGLHAMWMHQIVQRNLDRRRTAPPPPSPPKASAVKPPSPMMSVAPSSAALSADQAILPPSPPRTATRNLLAENVTNSGSQVAPPASNPTSNSSAPPRPPPPKPKQAAPLKQYVLDQTSRYLGWVGQLDLLLLFFPIARSNFLHWLLGSDFPTLVKYHRWLGVGTIWVFSLHSWLQMILYTWRGDLKEEMAWTNSGVNNAAGLISMLGGTVLAITALPYIRRVYFEVFYKTHIIGAVVFILFGMLHKKDMVLYILPGMLLYLLDLTFRIVQQNFNKTVISTTSNATLNADGGILTLSLACDKALKWAAADLVFLKVPSVSRWQWHPFTVASPSSPAGGAGSDAGCADGSGSVLKLHIKKFNGWTKALLTKLESGEGPLELYVGGPYGCDDAPPKWTGYRRIVLFAGGIGVTPILGILRDLLQRHNAAEACKDGACYSQDGQPLPEQVTFVWSSRHQEELMLIDPQLLAAASAPGSWLDLRLFYTGSGEDTAPVKIPMPKPHLEHSASQELPVPPRPLRHPYSFGPLLWCLAVVLCFFGAFGGLVLAQVYDAIYQRTHFNRVNYPWVGTLQFAAISVGAMLPPGLLMLALHLARSWSPKSHQLPAVASVDSDDKSDSSNFDSCLAKPPVSPAMSVMTAGPQIGSATAVGYDVKLAAYTVPKGEAVDGVDAPTTAAALAAFTVNGRPDIKVVLPHILDGMEDSTDVGVFVAGPGALVVAAQDACAVLNGVWGRAGRPYLDLHAMTFEL